MGVNGTGNGKALSARHQLRTLALSVWDLERTRKRRPDTPRSRVIMLRSHQRLLTAMEAARNIAPEHRSQIKIQESSSAACLLIHDWNGSPADMGPLADFLADKGMTVFSILLHGHGHPEDGPVPVMGRACIQDLQQRFQLLHRFSQRVFLVGVGFGSSLAIHLAAKDTVAGLALLAPALVPQVNLLERVLFRLGVHRLPFVRPRLGWSEEVLTTMQRARAIVPRLKVPVYAAQCDDDERYSPSSLRVLQKLVRHGSSRFRAFARGGHDILGAHGKDTLHQELAQFFRNP